MTAAEIIDLVKNVGVPIAVAGDVLRRRQEMTRAAAVLGLLTLGSPATIPGLVGPVIVDSVERVRRRRLLSHVSEEVCEGGAPAIAHGNSATAVISVRGVSGAVAAREHRMPSKILRRELAANGMSVLDVAVPALADHLPPQAPATPAGAVKKTRLEDAPFPAAVASAQPVRIISIPAISPAIKPKNQKSTESAVRDVYEWRHPTTLLRASALDTGNR